MENGLTDGQIYGWTKEQSFTENRKRLLTGYICNQSSRTNAKSIFVVVSVVVVGVVAVGFPIVDVVVGVDVGNVMVGIVVLLLALLSLAFLI